MPDLDQYYSALQKADAAGDTAGAKQLADYIRSQSAAPKAETYGEKVGRTGAALDTALGTGIRGYARAAEAAGETALDIGSGIAGDVAGAVTSVATQNPKAGERVSQAMHMQPETSGAKAAEQYVGTLTEPLAKLLNVPVDKLKKSGHPILSQIAQAAIDLAGTETGSETVKGLKNIGREVVREAPKSAATKLGELAGTEAGASATAKGAKAATTAAYEEVSKVVPETTDVALDKTHQVLKSQLAGINTAVDATATRVLKRLTDKQGDLIGSSTLDTAKKLRTEVGEEINWSGKWSPYDRKVKQLYDAMSEDIEESVKKHGGPQAGAAWEAANAANTAKEALTKKGLYRKLFNPETDTVASVQRTIKNMGKYGPAFTDEVHRRMGLDAKTGDFNANKFLMNWNRMPQATRQAVFGTKGPEYVRDLNDLVSTVRKLSDKMKTGKLNMPPGLHHMDFTRGDIMIAAVLAQAGSKIGIPHMLGFGAGLIVGKPIEAVFLNPKSIRILKNTARTMLAAGAETGRAALGAGVVGQQTANEQP